MKVDCDKDASCNLQRNNNTLKELKYIKGINIFNKESIMKYLKKNHIYTYTILCIESREEEEVQIDGIKTRYQDERVKSKCINNYINWKWMEDSK